MVAECSSGQVGRGEYCKTGPLHVPTGVLSARKIFVEVLHQVE